MTSSTLCLAGATGMVGAAIIHYLTKNFPTIKIKAVYYSNPPFIESEQVEYIQGDLQNLSDCLSVLQGCDGAILAAAQTSGSGVLTHQPWQQVNANLIMNANLFQALHQNNVKRVVWIGSASAYQDFSGSISEEMMDFNQDPPETYLGVGWVMRYLEKLAYFWHQQSMDVIIVRASNIFGPYARFNPQTSNFIPALIRKAVEKMDPFEVWGSPDVTRDVIYAADFAEAIVRLFMAEHIKYDVFNVGSEIQTTVGQVVDWALKYAGHQPQSVTYSSNKPTGTKWRALNCSKLREQLNWSPEFSIEKGIEATVEWWKENQERWTK